MKHALTILTVFLGSAMLLFAVPPGKYFISCARVPSTSDVQPKPHRGYLLTVAQDGSAEIFIPSESKVRVKKVEIIDGSTPGQFVLTAHFLEDLERSGEEVNRVLTLGISLNVNGGGGAEAFPGGTIYLKVDVRELPDAEQGGARQPAATPRSKPEGEENPEPQSDARTR